MKGQIVKSLKAAKSAVAVVTAILCLGITHSVSAVSLAQSPLFLAKPVTPIVMFNMSNDHQLYFKVYDDYSDIDGDGTIDTSYNNDYAYYGYFDEDKCYTHDGSKFNPSGWASNHHCSSAWSGNFLNWSTMTRIDVIRKILYGGKRSTDTATETVLERSYLPQDAHSFAKYYNGPDLSSLTPLSGITMGSTATEATGITICNTTHSASGYSEDVTAAPKMRVVPGNYSLWASNERYQCRWREEISNTNQGKNGNNSTQSGIYAYTDSPSSSTTGKKELTVRVKACDPAFVNADNNENCRSYASNIKPAGLLQTYGEDDSILFGLMTGSYTKNKSGGVLRKNATSMTDEIHVDGTFLVPTDSIIASLDLQRIFGYSHNNGTYNDGGADDCDWGKASFNNGKCANWGNPQSEIYLESLRYLAGKTASSAFNTNDTGKINGLKTAVWDDPVEADNYCAPLSVIQFNASTSSYDGDELSGVTSIGMDSVATLSAATKYVGDNSGANGQRFVGSVGGGDQLCTLKDVSDLSKVSGTCPDAPRLEGSYQIAGLAHYARTNSIGSIGGRDRDYVTTYGVALAPAVPKVTVGGVTILPACRDISTSPDGNCAIVDFKVIDDGDGDASTGTFYVNWEDTEQGGDFDQDMWGVIKYDIDGDELTMTTDVIQQSTGFKLGFGYVLSGTDNDGFHVHSGINDYNEQDCTDTPCQKGHGATSKEFKITGSSGGLLEQPLYYASLWGGFDVPDGTSAEDLKSFVPTGEPETYFAVTDPRELEESIDSALNSVAEGAGSAASVATNSTRLGTDTFIYQALFNTANWNGDLKAIQITSSGGIGDVFWTASEKLAAPDSRKIFTYDGSQGQEFEWGNLSADQKSALDAGDGAGSFRVDWIRGKDIGGMREREDNEKIGDIVNSDPVYGGSKDFGFGRMETHGGSSYDAFVATKSSKVVYVNSNDGMLHAFSAETGDELFAYIPSSIYDKLKLTTDSNYGSTASPHKYLVDGQIFVGDVYYGGSWKTLLVGALGAGGKGFFVLDVTNPSSFNESDVLYETNPTDNPEIGHIMGKPTIAPLTDGDWAIVVENGYESFGGEARLVIAKLGGAKLAVTTIDTGVAGNNGLAEPSMNIFGDGTVDAAYAGDLKGNLWKFDLENKKVAFSQGSTPKPLFVATDGSSTQPITAAPVLGINQQRKGSEGEAAIMVYFGTGSYLELNDLSDTSLQSFYGIADIGEQVERADLFEKTISQSGGTRDVAEGQEGETPELDWETHEGWRVDFTPGGERVNTKALLLFDRLIFPTIVPTDNPCDFGGTSWVMELIGVGDLYGSHGILDEKGTENDTLVSLSDLILGQDSRDEGVIIQQNSDGSLESIKAKPPAGAIGRQSWRQLR